MLIYYCLILVFCIEWIALKPKGESLVIEKSSSKHNDRFLVVSGITLVLFVGLRAHDIGWDTASYISWLEEFRGLSTKELFTHFNYAEKGYSILMQIAMFFRLSDTAFLFLIALLCYVPTLLLFRNYSSDSLMSLIIYICFPYFFWYSLGVFRQMIAVSILLLGFKYFLNKDWRYIIFIVLASTFHVSSLLMLPIFILYLFINSKIVLIATIPLEAIILLFGRFPIKWLASITKYSGYVGSFRDIPGEGYWMLLVLNAIFVFSIFCVYLKRDLIEDKLFTATLYLFAWGMILQCLGTHMAISFRTVVYCAIYMTILIPNLSDIDVFKSKWRVLIKVGIIVAFLAYFYIASKGDDTAVTVYRFVFQK